LTIEAANLLLVLSDLVLVSIPLFLLPFLGAKSSSLSSTSSAALLFFWLGATVVDSALFARGAASRAEHSCFGVSASASQKRSSVAMVVALGSFKRDSGCCRQYSSHFAHIAANSPRMTLILTARQTAGTVWWRPENTRVSEIAPMAVLKNASYGGRSPSCGSTHGPIADDGMVSQGTLKGRCLSCLQDVKSAFGVFLHYKQI